MEEEFGDTEVVRGVLRGIIGTLLCPNLCDFFPIVGKLNLDPHGVRRKHREFSMRTWALWETIVKERRESDKERNRDFLDVLISRGFTDDQINKLFEV